MAKRSSQTFAKRQRELALKEKQARKAEKRRERKEQRAARAAAGLSGGPEIDYDFDPMASIPDEDDRERGGSEDRDDRPS